MISNLANIASHRGKLAHLRDADLFSVTLKCHDEGGDPYYISLARDRITVSSYTDDAIRKQVEAWSDSVPDWRKTTHGGCVRRTKRSCEMANPGG